MIEDPFDIRGDNLTIEDFVSVARGGRPVILDAAVAARVRASRDALERKLARHEIIYGVSTGFGAHVKFFIPPEELSELQEHVLDNLSCGTGDPFPIEVVRGAMLLRAHALSKGYSGVRLDVITQLTALLNHGITPVVPQYGSVGASGDLVPSAHIANTLLGKGEVFYRGARVAAAEALAAEQIAPIRLVAKEGLGLVNGTTVMTSLAAFAVFEVDYLARLTLAAVAMTAEVLKATADSFRDVIHRIKNHPGQIEAGRLLRTFCAGSRLLFDLDALREQIRQGHLTEHETVELGESIQMPYSLRCAPQGLGPVLDCLAFTRLVIEREMNSVNDNPLLDGETEQVLHTGNFYGGHVGRVMDGLKIDIATLGNWSHQLMAMLMEPHFSKALPPSLSAHAGLHSGFKGMQLSQTSLIVLLRQMAAPSSIHSLPTEQYNQDIVSLGLHAAQSANEMASRLRVALSMLFLALCQAADLRGADGLGTTSAAIHAAVRQTSAFVDQDRAMSSDIARVGALVEQRAFPLMSV